MPSPPPTSLGPLPLPRAGEDARGEDTAIKSACHEEGYEHAAFVFSRLRRVERHSFVLSPKRERTAGERTPGSSPGVMRSEVMRAFVIVCGAGITTAARFGALTSPNCVGAPPLPQAGEDAGGEDTAIKSACHEGGYQHATFFLPPVAC